MERENALAVLGIAEDEERAYQAIVGQSAMGLDELADHWGGIVDTRVDARDLLARLQGLGLVDVVVGRPTLYRAARVGQVLEGLVLAQESALRKTGARLVGARAHIDVLARVQAESAVETAPGDLLEVIHGRGAIQERAAALMRDAREQVRCLDKPPYTIQTEERQLPGETDVLAAGIVTRGVYDVAGFEDPGKVRSVEEAVGRGEQARVLAEVPVKLLIGDDRVALLPFHSATAPDNALVAHPSPLLDALAALFESCWEIATPYGGGRDARPGFATKDASLILSLLAVGMPDRAIAASLGIGHRTLQKRLSEMLDETGVATRFELALRAAELGWVAPGRQPRRPVGAQR